MRIEVNKNQTEKFLTYELTTYTINQLPSRLGEKYADIIPLQPINIPLQDAITLLYIAELEERSIPELLMKLTLEELKENGITGISYTSGRKVNWEP